jgi:AcrR family transcriptional regulator
MAVRKDSVPRPLRADAADNRRKLLDAARDAFIELGPAAPLEEIARRAGTGIATLYRRFPDRESLMRDVVVDAIERTAQEARLAAEQEPDPFRALTRYMHRAIDVRTAAVIPALLGVVAMDDEQIERARADAPGTVEALVQAAHDTGGLRPDVTAADIGMLVIRMSRPLPGGFSRDLNRALSHRHLDLVIAGLRPVAPQPTVLGGPALTFDDLRRQP